MHNAKWVGRSALGRQISPPTCYVSGYTNLRCFSALCRCRERSKRMDWSHLYTGKMAFGVPLDLEAEVVRGFGRGSKELGIPTANLDMDELGESGESLPTGIYYGLACIKDREEVFRCVTSVGWNPFYKNEKKAIEVHIMHTLDDFYGSRLSVKLFGYLRDETSFKSVEELISCINSDINISLQEIQNCSEATELLRAQNASQMK